MENGGGGWKLLQGDNVGPNVALSGQSVLQASHDWCRYARRVVSPEAGRSFVLFPVECVLACRRGREFDLVQLLDSEIGRRGIAGFDTASLLDRFPPSVSFGEWYRSLSNVSYVLVVTRTCLDCLVAQVRRWAPELRGLVLSQGAHLCPLPLPKTQSRHGGSHPSTHQTGGAARW